MFPASFWAVPTFLLATAALAAGPSGTPRSLSGSYSPYEKQAIRSAEVDLASHVDPNPEGKIVERVDLVRLEPIEPRDPLPVALDAAHVRTREFVVRRELLLAAGDRYSKVLADESARNLRALPQLSLVVCTAFTGSAPGTVRLVVITKDVWSLLVDFDFGFGSAGFDYLVLEPEETNLLGTHQAVRGRFKLDPAAYAVGARYIVPRLDGRWVELVADGNVIFNRTSGSVEGSFGSLSAIHPFRTNRSPWAWFTTMNYRDEETRTFYRGDVARYAVGGDSLPYEYRTEQLAGILAITRSFGWKTKNDVSFGLNGAKNAYRFADQARTSAPSSAADFEVNVLPSSSTRVGPAVEWHAYTSDFLRTYELETLGLQEDFRLGHDVVLRGSPTLQLLPAGGRVATASRSILVALYGAVQETVPLGDGFARITLEAAGDVCAARESEDGQRGCPSALPNVSVGGRLRIATPRFGAGRLVEDAVAVFRPENELNLSNQYGGDSRLRGYPNAYVRGPNVVALSIEYRSPALVLATEQIGLAAFYDLAGAGPNASEIQTESAVGAGLRVVTPIVERSGLRIDVAFPIHPTLFRGALALPDPFRIAVAFGQAFDVGQVAETRAPAVK